MVPFNTPLSYNTKKKGQLLLLASNLKGKIADSIGESGLCMIISLRKRLH